MSLVKQFTKLNLLALIKLHEGPVFSTMEFLSVDMLDV